MPLLKKLQGLVRAGTIQKQLTFGDLVDVAFEGNHISETEKTALLEYNVKRKIAIDVDEYDNDMNLLDMHKKPEVKLVKAS